MRRIVFAALLLAGCQSTPAVIEPTPIVIESTPDNVAAQFADVAFGAEFGVGRGTLRRWQRRPSLWVYIEGGFDPRPYVRAGSDADAVAARISGLPIKDAADLESSTLLVAFVPRKEFRKHLPEKLFTDWDRSTYERFITTSACLAILTYDGAPDVISGAIILIGTDIPKDQMRHCIAEELVQIRGLPNDACHYRPSLFCESDLVYKLTEADKILLRTLYDSRLRPGMTKAEAMPIARQIIAEQMR